MPNERPLVPFIGEIKMFAGNYAPAGWLLCNGQLLNIAQYDALYSLLGTTYGGDGNTNFGVPDMRFRAPVHQGNGYMVGMMGGEAAVSLDEFGVPMHTHMLRTTAKAGTQSVPSAATMLADEGGTGASEVFTYKQPPDAGVVMLADAAVGTAGGGKAHENRQPFLAISFIIAFSGVYPSQD